MILAIDPGNTESGWCLIDEDYQIHGMGKDENQKLAYAIIANTGYFLKDNDHVVIEMVASYGMAVGQTVFETCVWIGRFMEIFQEDVDYDNLTRMYRKDVKMNLCGQTRAKDSNITAALVDRFSYPRHAAKGGKGTKADPGFFFGFKSDIWQAYALGVTWLDTNKL